MNHALPKKEVDLTLLSSTGEDAMLGLLKNTSIFLQLPNGCLCQATGKPLCELPPHAVDLPISPSDVVPTPVKLSSNFKRKQSPVVTEYVRPYKRQRVESPQVTRR